MTSYYQTAPSMPRGGQYNGGPGGGRPYYSTPAPPPALESFQKAFYKPHPDVAAMSEDQASKIRLEREIRILRGSASQQLKPLVKFEQAGFPQPVIDTIARAGFSTPSPIQSQSWPILLSGHDMIGIAETGSGKTLAFLLPAAVHIMAQVRLRPGDGPIALILAPTRELVEQIRQEAQKFVGALGLRVGVAYGGAARGFQLRTLRQGAEILVACPGRLIDFIESGNCSLNRVTYLVLDEADRMLDMGFEPQIRKIVEGIRSDRQTLMFSATWPKEVQGLARDLCRESPVHVTIGNTDLKASANVTQHVEIVSEDTKMQRLLGKLHELKQQDPSQLIIIFTETKATCDILGRELEREGFRAAAIHGDKSQDERTRVLNGFKQHRVPIMVATDVASRGLDVKDVKVVINYDMPNQIEDYVHRIGRTGRAGATGQSITFMTREKCGLASDLIRVMEEANQVVPAELRAQEHVRHTGGRNRGTRFGRRFGGGASRRSGPYYGGGNNNSRSYGGSGGGASYGAGGYGNSYY